MSGFDRVARSYRTLEYALFGRMLQRARTMGIPHLVACRDILLLGDGDGRFLHALLGARPDVRIHSVDASAKMLALAASKLTADQRTCVTFEHLDARRFTPEAGRYDAIVTLFFLDCFTPAEVSALVPRLSAALRGHGLWLFADFAIPSRGIARWYARALVRMLYLFFRWRTGLKVQSLPPSEATLELAGLRPIALRESRGGLVRSIVYQRDSLRRPRPECP